jgi:hypothetical protein
MNQNESVLRWKLSANYLYPLLNALICRRGGHSFKPDGPFLPSCRWCRGVNRSPSLKRATAALKSL